MICRKCGHMWFVPRELKCPNCGETISIEHSYQSGPPLDPDAIMDIIIENCFHLKKSMGLGPVLYEYSEKTLQYLKQIGYKVFEKKDHVLYMRKPQ